LVPKPLGFVKPKGFETEQPKDCATYHYQNIPFFSDYLYYSV